jgi:hypothetical protein
MGKCASGFDCVGSPFGCGTGLECTVKVWYLQYFFPVFCYCMQYFHVNMIYCAAVVHVALTDSEVLSMYGRSTNFAPTQRI